MCFLKSFILCPPGRRGRRCRYRRRTSPRASHPTLARHSFPEEQKKPADKVFQTSAGGPIEAKP